MPAFDKLVIWVEEGTSSNHFYLKASLLEEVASAVGLHHQHGICKVCHNVFPTKEILEMTLGLLTNVEENGVFKSLNGSEFPSFVCSQTVEGEMYPPTASEVPVHMIYPENVPPEKRLVIGHEVFGLLPGLTMYATIWLREHNRVCEILKAEHPTWDDEQLFQTTRLIIIGEGAGSKSSFSVTLWLERRCIKLFKMIVESSARKASFFIIV